MAIGVARGIRTFDVDTMKWWHLGLFLLDFTILFVAPLSATESGTGIKPEFAEAVTNATVSVGREAQLTCVVNHLGSYKVAWVKVDTQTILTIHHHVITRNYRINLSYSDHRYWHLHIKNVQESDRGYYMCQINTVPMKSQQGYLEVVIPPNIIDSQTSADTIVKEGANETLSCRATGHPKPAILWRREDSQAISLNNWEVDNVDGERLHITRVSRLHMGAYLCIASNGIPPSVSKRIVLQVHFPPQTWIPNQLVGGYVGGEVDLECHTEAFPKSINYWTTEQGDMLTSGDKYVAILMEDTYKMYMQLKIRNLEPKDFGAYRCIARNFMGETDGSVTLYEIPSPSTASTTTTERFNFETKDHLGEDDRSTAGEEVTPKRLKVNKNQGSAVRYQPDENFEDKEGQELLPTGQKPKVDTSKSNDAFSPKANSLSQLLFYIFVSILGVLV